MAVLRCNVIQQWYVDAESDLLVVSCSVKKCFLLRCWAATSSMQRCYSHDAMQQEWVGESQSWDRNLPDGLMFRVVIFTERCERRIVMHQFKAEDI